MSPPAWLAFLAAGAGGAALRFLVDDHVADRIEGGSPWGTFVVNLSGSFVLGVIAGLVLYHSFPETPAIVLGSGFCGAFTTFSTFAFETVRLVEEGAINEALRNAAGSLVACTAVAATGLALSSLRLW